MLALYEWNIREMPAQVLWRPFFLALGATGLLVLLLRGLTRDWVRSSLLASLFILLFSTYGQVHHALAEYPIYEHLACRFWLVGFVWLALLIGGCLMILKKQVGTRFLWALNLGALVLVAIPVWQIASHQLKPDFKPDYPSEWFPSVQSADARPDVYYFVLDGYARADFMEYRLGYDNGDFIQELTRRGFYISPCSRANYNNTIIALTSTFNMQYFSNLEAVAKSQGLGRSQIWRYLKPNITLQTFKSLGYETLAFDTGYYWSSIENVDTYLQPWLDPLNPPYMTAFEYLLLKSTPLVALYERSGELTPTELDDRVFPWRYHVAQQEYILDQAPRIAAIDAPTFAFIHILIPHEPMVFSTEGIKTSTLYFGGGGNWPTTPFAFQKAYVNGVQYVNPRMLSIVDQILQNSKTPPIIIVQGDHGFWSGTNLPILNAYYLPGNVAQELYPTISPVNTFRLIFDKYFGANLELLTDNSYLVKKIDLPVAEEMAGCKK